ncbi:MAG: tyrosine-type recombinase/integrase [Opitutales bacterium]
MKNNKTTSNNKNTHQDLQSEAILATQILKDTGISLIDAVRLIKNTLDFKAKSTKSSNIQFCSNVINSGLKHLHIKDMSIKDGFDIYLKSKLDLRPTSLRDIKYLAKRLFSSFPQFAKLNFSELTLTNCQKWLNESFDTAPQFNKALRMLNTFFNYALRQEWIDRNVVRLVQKRKVIENEIKALSLSEIKMLIKTSETPKFRDCKAGVSLLIWAGIRPQELERLTWQDIDLEENIITIRRNTSKTGGCRHIEICKPLKACLKDCRHIEICKPLKACLKDCRLKSTESSYVVPTKWQYKWKSLRNYAGFNKWIQDVLRHTYASYHAKNYKDLARLQLNMGHSNLHLLRSRYINFQNISKLDAKKYFSINTQNDQLP